MTIATTISKVVVNGNGLATIFSFSPVVIFQASDIQVYYTNSLGVTTLLSQGTGPLNYSVSVTEYPGTGSIIYPGGGGAILPVGEKLTILRVMEEIQDTNLQNQGAYYPETLETALDKIVCMLQQVQEEVDRAYLVPTGSTVDPNDLITQITNDAASVAANTALVQAAVSSINLIQATESQIGITKIATQAQVNGGTLDTVTVTPLKLANSTLATRVTTAENNITANAATSAAAIAAKKARNYLINSSFQVQSFNSTSVTTDDTYITDQWIYLNNLAAGSTARVNNISTDSSSGFGYYPLVMSTGIGGGAGQAGILQIIENKNAVDLVGQTVTFSIAAVANSNGTNLSMAILEYSAADNVVSDVVNNWASTTLTKGNFFTTDAALTVRSASRVTTSLPSGGSARQIYSITATINPSATAVKNIIVMAWCNVNGSDSSGAVNLSCPKLEVGSSVTPYTMEPYETELLQCQRYFQSSFLPGVTPAQNVGANTGEAHFPQVVAASTAKKGDRITFPVAMRSTPAITLYNPAAANANARNLTLPADATATAATNSSVNGFDIEYTSAASTSAGQVVGIHWSADSRL